MPTGPVAKGPRLWLQPGRDRDERNPEPAVWVIRDDGGYKRSTGRPADDRGGAELELARYIASKRTPLRRRSDPAETPSADVLSLYGRDVVPGHARPKESLSRLKRLGLWWGQPVIAMRSIEDMGLPAQKMTGMVGDVTTATCQAYVKFVGAPRSASMDLEMFRAAINHAVDERVLERSVPVWLPPKPMRRERWLTRSEVARIIWQAWRSRRSSDGLATRKHLARFAVIAHYTGTRSAAICNSSFERKFGFGFIDLENGVWYRQATGKRATKKRQPPVPLPRPLLAHLRRWRANGQTYPVEHRGQPVERVARAMRALIRECGFGREVVVHTFRHTAITWAMQRGADPWQASGYFGLNLQTLVDNYGHHHPDHLYDVVEKMARPTTRRQSYQEQSESSRPVLHQKARNTGK